MDITLGIVSFLGIFFVIYQSHCKWVSVSIVSLPNNRVSDSISLNKYLQLGYQQDLIEVTYTNLYVLFDGATNQGFCNDDKLKQLLENTDVKELLIDICIDLNLEYPKNSEIFDFENQKGPINSFELILQFVSDMKLNKN